MSVEKILERFYNLEHFYQYKLKKRNHKNSHINNKKLKYLNKDIDKIDNEIKIENKDDKRKSIPKNEN